MAVKHMRIDNRLIHGQVTTNWVQAVGAKHILVVNDQVAADPIQRVLLPKAARGIKTSVVSVADAIAYANDPDNGAMDIFMVVKFPADALSVIVGGVIPKEINVGNQAPIPGTDFKMVTKSIAVTSADATLYREIAAKGFTLTAQMLPSDGRADFISLMEKKGL